MKYTLKETCEVTRCYEIEADSPDEALDKMYSGEYEPTLDVEDGNSVYIFDENGKNVSNEE